MLKEKISQMRSDLGLPKYNGNLYDLKSKIEMMKRKVGYPEVKKEVVVKQPTQKAPVSISDKLKSFSKVK